MGCDEKSEPLEITHNDAEIMGNYASKSDNTVQETCKAESPAPCRETSEGTLVYTGADTAYGVPRGMFSTSDGLDQVIWKSDMELGLEVKWSQSPVTIKTY